MAEHRLLHAGLPLPRLLVCAGDVVRGKPDPEPYLLAASRLGLAPADCLVFEDAPAGIASALFDPEGFYSPDDADFFFTSLADIPKTLMQQDVFSDE